MQSVLNCLIEFQIVLLSRFSQLHLYALHILMNQNAFGIFDYALIVGRSCSDICSCCTLNNLKQSSDRKSFRRKFECNHLNRTRFTRTYICFSILNMVLSSLEASVYLSTTPQQRLLNVLKYNDINIATMDILRPAQSLGLREELWQQNIVYREKQADFLIEITETGTNTHLLFSYA